MEAGYKRVRGLPLHTWDGLPTINKPAVKIEPPPPGSFYDDEELKGMDFRLANMTYYYGHDKKLVDDMKEVKTGLCFEQNIFVEIFPQFQPGIIMLAFCYSLNSDVSMLLRRCGLFSIMVLSHDLKMLTKNPNAKLNENQRKFLEEIGIN